MQNLATQEQIQQGCPLKISLQVKAPQNGHQSLESSATLIEYSATVGSVHPQEIEQASQHYTQQLSQLAMQEISNQFGLPQGGSQQSRQGQWGQPRAAQGGSR